MGVLVGNKKAREGNPCGLFSAWKVTSPGGFNFDDVKLILMNIEKPF